MEERFEWDENKNKINFQKHKISFNEAQTVFSDDFVIYIPDENHSEDEERFIAIGESARSRLLIVCHCYRENKSIIRLISARRADSSETELYYGGVP
jgi:uncharacterized DUF497 family protein